MTRKASSTDIDNAIRDYIAGDSIEVTARRYHIGDVRLTTILRDKGLFRDRTTRYCRMGAKIATTLRSKLGVNAQDIVRRYVAGESELSIANDLGISRNVVEMRLTIAHIPRRGVSAANRIRFTNPIKRAITTRKAHFSMGRGENEVCALLEARGYKPLQQAIIDRYNIDLLLPAVVVEVHWQTGHPFYRAHDRKRLEYLTNSGWNVIYIWVTPPHPLTDTAADYIVAFQKQTRGNPSGIGEYRVIRGTGELVASGRGNIN
jgi:very-short-patch-repair endonuclease